MMCDVNGLRHIFEINFRIAFDKRHPVNLKLEYRREAIPKRPRKLLPGLFSELVACLHPRLLIG